jgi:hypothetical protein
MPKALDFRPSGTMDARSSPDELQLSDFRYLQNFRLTTKNKLSRVTGFDRLMASSTPNNADLHDQLLSLTGFADRLPVTFLYQATSTRKATKLIAGTSKALYALNTSTRNWKILADIYGTSTTRWRAAQLEDAVVFSNNHDALVYWQFDQGVTEDDDQSVAPIPDLQDEIELTRAGVVVGWKGHIFLMNVTVSGTVQSNGIYWCNFKKPLDWLPSDSSTAGNTEVDYGETILAAKPLLGRLIIFTNKGIYEMSAVGGEEVFAVSPRYQSEDGENCLFYPNTLVSKGDELVYAGADGIYTFSLFSDKPKRVEWIHKATAPMFDNINRSNCDVHVAGYDIEHKELLFSYAVDDEDLPSETLVLNTEYPHAHIIDHGFSAMSMYVMKDNLLIIRDFLKSRCVCTEDELDEHWNQFEMEGQFCSDAASEALTLSDGSELTFSDGQPMYLSGSTDDIECDNPPNSIYTTSTKTTTYRDETVVTEDWDAASETVNSLCDQLDGLTLNGLCELEARADECSAGQRFVVASSEDYCLKEFADVYYREICTDFDDCGEYSRTGYQSLIRSGPINGGVTDQEKRWKRFELEAAHVAQSTPSQWKLRIGNHSQAVDPNDDNCGIIWDEQDAKDIDCLGGDTAEGHASAGTRPSETYDWPLYYTGNYLYFELSVVNPDADPEDTGGEVSLSRFTIDMEVAKGRR